MGEFQDYIKNKGYLKEQDENVNILSWKDKLDPKYNAEYYEAFNVTGDEMKIFKPLTFEQQVNLNFGNEYLKIEEEKGNKYVVNYSILPNSGIQKDFFPNLQAAQDHIIKLQQGLNYVDNQKHTGNTKTNMV